MNSAIVAPTTESVVATFKEGKIYGKEFGNLNFKKIWDFEADKDRNKSKLSVSIAVNPLTALTSIGKKATKEDITILGSIPLPNQITKTGAKAYNGVAFSAIAYGYTAFLVPEEYTNRTAIIIPKIEPKIKPKIDSVIVIVVSFISEPRL